MSLYNWNCISEFWFLFHSVLRYMYLRKFLQICRDTALQNNLANLKLIEFSSLLSWKKKVIFVLTKVVKGDLNEWKKFFKNWFRKCIEVKLLELKVKKKIKVQKESPKTELKHWRKYMFIFYENKRI